MNEKAIWDFLKRKTGNEIGTAAIMGNLMAESSLNPHNATGSKDPDYVYKADIGGVDFANDGVAFGLVQWCFRTRKQGLLTYSRQHGTSVGDLTTQLEYLWLELKESYKSVYTAVTTAKSIREASDIVMLKYEKPGTTTEAAKKKRADYGQKFYDQFAEKKPEPQPTPAPTGKKIVVATAKVNLRAGAGLTNLKVGSLPKGQSLQWIESKDGWHKVAVWVSGDFSEVRG